MRCWAENGVLDNLEEGSPEGFISPAQISVNSVFSCLPKEPRGQVKCFGQLLLLQGELFFFADCPQQKGKRCHCSWPLTSRHRLGSCQACADRQNRVFQSLTALVKRPFVVTLGHSQAISQFGLCDLFWSFM